MEFSPFFSVLIPVYNQKGKMDGCIASLKNQSFQDFEVIFVDDGSTDGSSDMLNEYCTDNPGFSMIRLEKNSSLIAARIAAMKQAAGKYIFLLDSDDEIEPYAFKDLFDSLSASPVDVLCFGVRREPSGQILMPARADDLTAAVLKGIIPPAAWKNCYSASAVQKALSRVEPFYCNMGEDTFFSVVLFTCAESFGYLDEALYIYYAGGMSSTSGTVNTGKIEKSLESVKASGKKITEYVRKYAPEYLALAEKASVRLIKYILYQNIYYETDWCTVYDVLKIFNKDEYRDIFLWGCSEILKAKVLRKEGKKISVSYDLDFIEEN